MSKTDFISTINRTKSSSLSLYNHYIFNYFAYEIDDTTYRRVTTKICTKIYELHKLYTNTKGNNNYLFSLIPNKQAIYCAVQERQDKRQRSFSTLLPQVISLTRFHFSDNHVILPLRDQATLGIYAKNRHKQMILRYSSWYPR